MAQNTGKAKKGKNHRKPAKKAPRIGLNTLPKVFEVSITPRELLTSSSFLNISPTKGMTIGAPPAAPIPCSDLPIRISQ
ncbi:Uncharacterised protein [Mycobacteroides abscessus subsp. abscessus]|nr:Uncharacterised protein [Mycobacteroides abscessus subsp. abscessus]